MRGSSYFYILGILFIVLVFPNKNLLASEWYEDNRLRQKLSENNVIFLGENHEVMGDREMTYEILETIMLSRSNETKSCLFIEVPSSYQSLLDSYLEKKKSYREFLQKLPRAFHKMFSREILDLGLSRKLKIHFFDHPDSTSMPIRNKYMAELMILKSCRLKMTINGSRHLMETYNSRGERVKGIPNYLGGGFLNLAFIPDYREQAMKKVFNEIPQFFVDIIEDPRSSSGDDWYSFDAYISVPVK